MISFLKERPPLVVFLLCLICTSLTLLCFSFYMETIDSVSDNDTIYDWNRLLKYLKELKFCISDENGNTKSTSITTGMVTIGTQVKINLSKLKDYSEVRGLLKIDGWYTTCKKKQPKPRHLEIYFKIPAIVENITDVEVCISITGPAEYFPTFSEPNCVVKDSKLQKQVGYLTSVRKAEYTEHFCQNGVETKLEFLPQIKDTITNVLGNNQKNLIYVHLLWTSFILIFAILAIIIYSVFQSDTKLDRYIEKCTNLIQNR